MGQRVSIGRHGEGEAFDPYDATDGGLLPSAASESPQRQGL